MERKPMERKPMPNDEKIIKDLEACGYKAVRLTGGTIIMLKPPRRDWPDEKPPSFDAD